MSVYIDTNVRCTERLIKLIVQKTENRPNLTWNSIEHLNAEELFVELGEREVRQGHFFYYKWKEALRKDIEHISVNADIDDIAYHIWNTTCVIVFRNGKIKEKCFYKYIRKYFPLWYRIPTSKIMGYLAVLVPMFVFWIVPFSLYGTGFYSWIIAFLSSAMFFFFVEQNKGFYAPIVTIILNVLFAALFLIVSPKTDYFINSERLVKNALYNLIPFLFIPCIFFWDEKYRGRIFNHSS